MSCEDFSVVAVLNVPLKQKVLAVGSEAVQIVPPSAHLLLHAHK